MHASVKAADIVGEPPLELVLDLLQPRLDTLQDGQRDMKVLVWVDVSEPVFDRGGKLDLLEHVFACLLEDELDHFRACARVARRFRCGRTPCRLARR